MGVLSAARVFVVAVQRQCGVSRYDGLKAWSNDASIPRRSRAFADTMVLSRRDLIAGGGAIYFAGWPLTSHAQRDKIPLLGWLSSTPGSDPLFEALRAGLRELDYVEGHSIRIEASAAQDNAELRALAREFVRRQVAVIVANGRAATREPRKPLQLCRS